MAAQIDEEVNRLLSEAYGRCETILTQRRAALDAVARYLLEHETMEREAFLAVVEGRSPEEPDATETAPAEAEPAQEQTAPAGSEEPES